MKQTFDAITVWIKDKSAPEHNGPLIPYALGFCRGSGTFFTLLVKKLFHLWECKTSIFLEVPMPPFLCVERQLAPATTTEWQGP